MAQAAKWLQQVADNQEAILSRAVHYTTVMTPIIVSNLQRIAACVVGSETSTQLQAAPTWEATLATTVQPE